MSSLNGTGTKFLSFTELQEDGTCYATQWVVFLFIPIIPMYRAHIHMQEVQQDGAIRATKYELIGKTKLIVKEVLITYLYGWILFPSIGFGPMLLCNDAIQELLHINIPIKGFIHPAWGDYFLMVSIIWLIVFAIMLRRWDMKRGFKK